MLKEALTAFLVTGVFAVLAYWLGTVSLSGTVGGFVVGSVIYISLGWQGFAVLALFVIGGSTLTRLGYARKQSAGVAESGSGRRGARNALANAGVAVVCAVLAAATPYQMALAAAFVASLGAAFADTAESEVGQLARRRPRLITTLKSVPPGTDGAVSWPGTLAGFIAAGLTAALGLAVGLIGDLAGFSIVALAAFFGTVVDSLAGALMPRIGNELTNLLCTLSAAVAAVAFINLT